MQTILVGVIVIASVVFLLWQCKKSLGSKKKSGCCGGGCGKE